MWKSETLVLAMDEHEARSNLELTEPGKKLNMLRAILDLMTKYFDAKSLDTHT